LGKYLKMDGGYVLCLHVVLNAGAGAGAGAGAVFVVFDVVDVVGAAE
jgi:hypothetical protein